jgi:hypothetical protein
MANIRTILLLALLSSAAPTLAEQPTLDATTPPKPKTEKVICKTFPKTGSLISTYKACKPAREWEREREALTQGAGVSDACRDRANGGGACGL